jgi:membrane protein implicated in regulation of membrane protease activity
MHAPSTIWLVCALIALGAEFMSGTFYLLVVAIALSGGGLAAWLALDIPEQFLCASTAGIIAFALVTRWKRHNQASTRSARNANDPDLGQEVRVLRSTAPGLVRVFYRGAEWDAQVIGSTPQAGQMAIIVARDGNLLKISLTPAGNI